MEEHSMYETTTEDMYSRFCRFMAERFPHCSERDSYWSEWYSRVERGMIDIFGDSETIRVAKKHRLM